MADDTSDLPPLPISLALAGYSTVGKDTLTHELAKRFSFQHISAGDVFKQEVMRRYALGPEYVYGNGMERDTPLPALPQVNGRHMTPREVELDLQDTMPRNTLAIRNRNELEDLFDARQPFVFNGYRFIEQDKALRGLQAKYKRFKLCLLRVRIISPQVPVPVPYSRYDTLLDKTTFDAMLWNDKTKPPTTMLEQLNIIVTQITKAPLF